MLRRRRYFLLHWSLTKLISKTRNKLCSYYIVNGCNLLVNRDNGPIQMFPLFFYHYVKPFTRSEKSRIWESIIYSQRHSDKGKKALMMEFPVWSKLHYILLLWSLGSNIFYYCREQRYSHWSSFVLSLVFLVA